MSRDAEERRRILGDFGGRVRSLRKDAGLTQDELAQAAQLHRVTVAKVEAGLREVGLTSIVALAAALGLTTSELVDGVSAAPGDGLAQALRIADE